MPRLRRVSGREAVRAFQRAGFMVVRQRGSHIVLRKPGNIATLSVPNHRQVAVGTLRAQIRKAGLSVDEFMELLT